jgi:hypothetical protein
MASDPENGSEAIFIPDPKGKRFPCGRAHVPGPLRGLVPFFVWARKQARSRAASPPLRLAPDTRSSQS